MSTNSSVKSFQNCLETEVPGYNDCPSFLYQVNRASTKRGRRSGIAAKVRDTCGNITAASVPPPLTESAAKETDNETQLQILSKEQVLEKVRDVYNAQSKLSAQEFEFYRRKVDLNMMKSLESESTRRVLTTVLQELGNKDKCARMLREWLSSDVTICSWCPAFLKIYENASII